MVNQKRFVSVVCVLVFSFVTGSAAADATERVTRGTVDRVVSSWPAHPRDGVKKMIAKYGLPNEVTASKVTWFSNGPWKRTIVYRDEIPHDFPKPHTDFVEQFVDYRAPSEKLDQLAAYDGSVIAERTKGEISARCDKEEMNFLALNLANDILTGARTVDQGRQFYAETAMATMRGEKPAYTRGFQFSVAPAGTGDRDRPIIPQSVLASMPPPPPETPGTNRAINPNIVRVTQNDLDNIVSTWPSHPRDAANTLISKYGLPQEITPTTLTWINNGPWKRTIVYRDEIPHDFPKPHTDFVQQFIDYKVPIDKFGDLALYDGSVINERTKGEISARCDKEEMNLLALNLANDVATGAKSVDQARQFYADTAVATMKGEKPAYTTALQFTRPAIQTADRDMSIIPAAMISSATTEATASTEATTPRRHRHFRKE